MIVDLKSIPGKGVKTFELSLDRNWWIPDRYDDNIDSFESPVKVRIEIYRVDNKFVLNGTLRGTLRIICDRCLELFSQEIKSDFNSFLIPSPEDIDKVELELMEDDMDVSFIENDEVNLDDIIREQFYLSIPIKSICRENCLGLCSKCGCNLNKFSCDCIREQGHPGFSVLKKLKN